VTEKTIAATAGMKRPPNVPTVLLVANSSVVTASVFLRDGLATSKMTAVIDRTRIRICAEDVIGNVLRWNSNVPTDDAF
jgi:hypothetical protein